MIPTVPIHLMTVAEVN